jgi:hypothetical protein
VAQLESKYVTVSVNRDVECTGSVATSKLQSVVHTCGEGMEIECETYSSAAE